MSRLINVKNNHDAILGVAGIDINPGKTVGVSPEVLKRSLGSHGFKIWLKMGLINIVDDEKFQAFLESSEEFEKLIVGENVVKLPGGVQPPVATREQLEEAAAELGVQGQLSKMKDETLIKKIEEIKAASEND